MYNWYWCLSIRMDFTGTQAWYGCQYRIQVSVSGIPNRNPHLTSLFSLILHYLDSNSIPPFSIAALRVARSRRVKARESTHLSAGVTALTAAPARRPAVYLAFQTRSFTVKDTVVTARVCFIKKSVWADGCISNSPVG